MVIKSCGVRRKTRKKLKARKRLTVNDMLKKFDKGETICIGIASSLHNFPHPKFHGKTGKIIERRGNSYVVEVSNLNRKKQIIVSSMHLKRMPRRV